MSGITTSVLLLKLGYHVRVFTKHDPLAPPTDPTHVSAFPSASVIPHSVEHPAQEELLAHSQIFFEWLHKKSFKGLGINEHFELSATEEDLPKYATTIPNFVRLEDHDLTKTISHPEIIIKSGWRFNCFFADWAVYFPELLKMFDQLGGELVLKELSHSDLKELDAEVIVNCAEFGGPALAGNIPEPKLLRGHLLHVEGAPLLKNERGQTVSYNFTPGFEVYSSEAGSNCDVYCYPRKDGWILGGSRQSGTVDEAGNWIGEENSGPTVNIGNKEIPSPILSLNREIIKQSFGVDLNEFPRISSRIGYRYMGNSKAGLCLEAAEIDGRLIISNYGHGGAGVTLSWGCAAHIASLLSEKKSIRELLMLF